MTGTSLPTTIRTIAQTDMVAYAGATWDWHRLHHDAEYARAIGLEAPVVDGQMFGAMMAAQVSAHFGLEWRLEELDFRFASMVHAGETVELSGIVENQTAEHAACSHTVTVGDRVCVTGKSTVAYVG